MPSSRRISSVCSANCGARRSAVGVSSNCTGLVTSSRVGAVDVGDLGDETVGRAPGDRGRARRCPAPAPTGPRACGSGRPSSRTASTPITSCTISAALGGVRQQLLGGVPALVVDHVLAAEVATEVGPELRHLDHGEVEEPAVGGPHRPRAGIGPRLRRVAHRSARPRLPVGERDVDRKGVGPQPDAQQRHVEHRRLAGALPGDRSAAAMPPAMVIPPSESP